MLTKEFLEKHFKFHRKLKVYQYEIPLTVTKRYHPHVSGGHVEMDVHSFEDLEDLFKDTGVTLKPRNRPE